MTYATDILASLADELGAINADIADREARAKEIKAILTASGHSKIEGSLFRVAISTTLRESLDTKAIREHVSADVLAPFIKSTPVTVVRVSGR